ncbi:MULTISPECIES: hypothetical protein [Flavobacteriaceae]|uniref:Uncharacterized protein n=1 Tax=Meridianimaribacter flavus TaxID=571115 RepID=A0ABY2G7G7_9FLAO|nr:hypothetical protein [Meridianimaribacter flavus]TDY13746.1 hypothetical protein A8975_0341 [Meridianimaribacter flavus]
MYKSEFIIKEPNVPWFYRIVFSLIFTSFFGLMYFFFSSNIIQSLTSSDIIKMIIFSILIFITLIYCFTPIVAQHSIHFNFSEHKIKHSYAIGIFNHNEKWQNLEDLNYISMFSSRGSYQVNLWYGNNKFLNLFLLDDYDSVIEKAFIFSDKLNIDLLDARERGNHRWVNKDVYRETKQVKYL